MTTNDLAHEIAFLSFLMLSDPARLCQPDGAEIELHRQQLIAEYGRRAVLGPRPTAAAFTDGLQAAFPGLRARALGAGTR